MHQVEQDRIRYARAINLRDQSINELLRSNTIHQSGLILQLTNLRKHYNNMAGSIKREGMRLERFNSFGKGISSI